MNVRAEKRSLRREDVNPQLSILAQRKDPDQYPEITYLGNKYRDIRVYRDWEFGRGAPARRAQEADLNNIHISEDFLNLGMVLNRMRMDYPLKQKLVEMLSELYPGISDYDTFVNAGKVQVILHEGRFAVPATRLSDGTLRWLCLLAILLDPTPPPLVCIEEPELGLHPDVLPTLAQLLREASERTQLIVTTHSEVLVDAVTETPECVVVCEKDGDTTGFTRLSKESLADWLEKYSLGQLGQRAKSGKSLVKIKLYVEGGGNDNRALRAECRRAFAALFGKAGLTGRKPSVHPCGGRQQAYDDFCIALRNAQQNEFPVLLVDSETPVSSEPWQHVHSRDGDNWERPQDAGDDQLHLMVQVMETWFLQIARIWRFTSAPISTRTDFQIRRSWRTARSKRSPIPS